MTQTHRLSSGGIVDRDRPLAFTFNGTRYSGYAGDTLASALLANGVHLVGRSFKLHRPRGILAAGAEDPGTLVQIGEGAETVPNLRATQLPLVEGLAARSVNVFPSVKHDIAAGLGWFSRLFAAGFYYKTFFGSRWLWEHAIEPSIRRAGGWGTAPTKPDPDRYDHRHVHCEVLVVGAGPAGLMAARAAAGTGARVILADADTRLGGSLLSCPAAIDGAPGPEWAARTVSDLSGMDQVRVLPRTTVFGYYDDNYLCAVESVVDGPVRERVWHIRAGKVVLATGAHERPLVFADNDKPGIMLAGAIGAYIDRWGVVPGRRMVAFANNDRAYRAVLSADSAGIHVAAVVDPRADVDPALAAMLAERGIDHLTGHVIARALGGRHVTAVDVQALGADGAPTGERRRLACDLVGVSGGYSPAVHLFSHAQGKLAYDSAQACLRPSQGAPGQISAGAGNGTFDLAAAMAEGLAAGRAAVEDTGHTPAAIDAPGIAGDWRHGAITPLWRVPTAVPASRAKGKAFVDLQNDTTAADIHLAVREGFESVEHVKRYTLTGFGTDQGKTSNINALGILAGLVGKPIEAIGTTTFRPPYTAVTFGALGGRHRGAHLDPERLTAMHDWHVAHGALFEDVGQWKRPWYYPLAGEDMTAAVARECRAVRTGVGVLDASTLGKIDIQGPDAAAFLNRVYTNGWKTLKVGRARYGIMCGEDGMVFDDGTTARIDENRYFMTTTSGGAARVMDHLEEYLQTEWPELRVRLTSTTEQWANVTIAGPKSRDVLAALAPDMDLAPDRFTMLDWRDATVAGITARIFRVSFTGELQYEINVPWRLGPPLWDAVMEAGAPHGITPYGTETMHVLRAEKGFIIAGQDTDGSQAPDDIGLGKMVSTKKDFIGRRSLSRPDTMRADRKQLVGLLPAKSDSVLPEGTQLVEPGTAGQPPPVAMLGFVTSSYWSETMGRSFALALVAGGRARHGETIEAALPTGPIAARICDPVFYDPKGERHDGL